MFEFLTIVGLAILSAVMLALFAQGKELKEAVAVLEGLLKEPKSTKFPRTRTEAK